jgi:hypothetical protein
MLKHSILLYVVLNTPGHCDREYLLTIQEEQYLKITLSTVYVAQRIAILRLLSKALLRNKWYNYGIIIFLFFKVPRLRPALAG